MDAETHIGAMFFVYWKHHQKTLSESPSKGISVHARYNNLGKTIRFQPVGASCTNLLARNWRQLRITGFYFNSALLHVLGLELPKLYDHIWCIVHR